VVTFGSILLWAVLLAAGRVRRFYWLIGAGAALTAGTVAFAKGPRSKRVVWDVPREHVEAADAAEAREEIEA
jgi:hypothetical protein